MTVKELFEFITDPTICDDNVDDYLEKVSERIADRDVNDLTEQEKVDQEVFKNAYIPKRLDEVINVERDIVKAKTGAGDELVYTKIIGLNDELAVQKMPGLLRNEEEIEKISDNATSDSGSDEETCSDDDDDETNSSKFKDSARPRDESPESKKNRKKAVKEAQAEKRKQKLKKHVKKRKEKLGTKKK